MQIRSIAITNLASLLGAQTVIDLVSARSPIGGAGLIAITGPTGAGKSTILDALCLALFNETPRQDRSPGEAILSRGATSGAVAVELALDDGHPYRLTWSVRRSRDRLDGALQAVDRAVVDAATGDTIVTGSAVKDWVQRNLRLSAAQFRTAVLLAQGDFNRFLQADDDERAQLLALLAGDDLYTRLGVAAHAQARTLNDDCAIADAAIAGLQVLEPAARAERQQALQAAREERPQREAHLTAAQECRRRLETAATTTRQMTQAQVVRDQAIVADHAAAPQRERYRAAMAVLPVVPALLLADAAERQVAAARTQVMSTQERVAAAQERCAASRAAGAVALATAEDARTAVGQILDREAPLAALTSEALTAVDAALTAASQARQQATLAAQEHQRLGDRIPLAAMETAKRHLAQTEAALLPVVEAARAAQETLDREREAGDQVDLEQIWTVLQQAVPLLATPLPDVAASSARLTSAEAVVVTTAAAVTAIQAEAATAAATVVAAEQQLQVVQTLGSLGAFTHLVIPDQPCPLCGSVDHPAPLRGVDDRIQDATSLLLAARADSTRVQSRMHAAVAVSTRAVSDRDHAQRDHLRCASERQRAEDQWRPVAQAAGLDQDRTQVFLHEIQSRVAAVAARREALNAAQRAAEAIHLRLQEARHARDQATQAVAHASAAMDQARQQIVEAAERMTAALAASATAQAKGDAAVEALALRVGERPDAVDHTAGDAAGWVRNLAQRAEVARRRRQDVVTLDQRLAECRGVLPGDGVAQNPIPDAGAAVKAAVVAVSAVTADTTAFTIAVAAHTASQLGLATAEHQERTARIERDVAMAACPSISDVAAVRAAMLPDTERQQLADVLVAIDTRLALARQTVDDAQAAWEAAQAAAAKSCQERGIDSSDPEALTRINADEQAAKDGLQAVDTRIGALTRDLTADDQAQAQRAALLAGQEGLRRRRDRAERLKQVLGRADGADFNRVAQALTLDQLLALANHHLRDLAPRYALRRDPASNGVPSLGLRLIDHDQGDLERPASTLSGGESFLTSLALALADLQRGRLRIGTLCVDEGFGTLDETTLSLALATLERLQQRQGTQILLISHVGALHERIAHRIEVIRRGNGSSYLRLAGPGRVEGYPPALPTQTRSAASDARDQEAILDHLRNQGSISAPDLGQALGLDLTLIRRHLATLIENHGVTKTGAGKGTRYQVI